ncbi:MAG: hypothetical protein AMJ93_08575 [Anaerolineae bacterium SM23_84]|nr:MAG: hypothetical protein AMJ93_08575 [Anaerolineae bacterium SM23_84]
MQVKSEQRFTIEGELPSLNQYIDAERSTNRGIAAAVLKRNATIKVRLSAVQDGLLPVGGPVWITFLWFVPDRRKDPDNVVFAKKFVLDGLVWAGILPNDGMRWIRHLEDGLAVDRDNPRIEVIIRELPE